MTSVVNEQADEKVPVGVKSIPYPPSWFDKLEAQIDKLPGHYLIYYVVFGVLIGLLSTFSSGTDLQHIGPFSPITRIYGAFLITYLLGMTHYLDRAAADAIDKIKPSLELDESSFALVKYRLTNLPARTAVVVSLSWVLILFISLGFYPDLIGFKLDLLDLAHQVFILQGILVWWMLGLGAYHTIHQLREVSRTHETYLQVNLYNLGDLYSLSGLSAISSIGVIAPVTIAVIVMPDYVIQPMGVAFLIVCSLVAGATLTWPLWNIHQAMVREKVRIQAACSTRYEALLGEWHDRIDERQLNGNSELYATIKGLAAEKEEIEKIPTWPWSPGMLRGWIASLFLPLAIWTIQVILENLVFRK
jgi:hypothetical protein